PAEVARSAAAGGRALPAVRLCPGSHGRGRQPLRWRAAAGGDHQGVVPWRRAPHPGRTHGGAGAPGGRRAVQQPPPARRTGENRHLHQPQARRGAGHLGPDHRASPRARRRHSAGRRHDQGAAGGDDGGEAGAGGAGASTGGAGPGASGRTAGARARAEFTQGALLNRPGIRGFVRRRVGDYDIRVADVEAPVLALSGGNQQKVVVAREFSFAPQVLVAAQPTRGLDIGATEFVMRQLLAARSSGMAVLLVSANLEEILSLSDRVGVMYGGALVAEFARGEVSAAELGLYMTGAGRTGEARAGWSTARSSFRW